MILNIFLVETCSYFILAYSPSGNLMNPCTNYSTLEQGLMDSTGSRGQGCV